MENLLVETWEGTREGEGVSPGLVLKELSLAGWGCELPKFVPGFLKSVT